jgi:hypothetical protein
MNRRHKRTTASLDLPPELVAYMLTGRVGPSTYALAQRVCKAWRTACDDVRVLEAAINYCGEFTRTQFRGVLHLTYEEACTWCHITRRNTVSGGPCYVYSSVIAIEALHALGGLAGLRARPSIFITHATLAGEKRRTMIRLEDDAHRRKVMREAMDRVRRLPIKELLSASSGRAVAVA